MDRQQAHEAINAANELIAAHAGGLRRMIVDLQGVSTPNSMTVSMLLEMLRIAREQDLEPVLHGSESRSDSTSEDASPGWSVYDVLVQQGALKGDGRLRRANSRCWTIARISGASTREPFFISCKVLLHLRCCRIRRLGRRLLQTGCRREQFLRIHWEGLRIESRGRQAGRQRIAFPDREANLQRHHIH